MVHHNIKALGIYECRVALHPEVAVTVSINVARSEEEARSQLAEAMETKKKEAEEAKKGVTADTEKAGKKGKRKKSAKEEKSEGSRDSQQSEEAAGAGAAPSPEPSPGTSRDGGEETSSEPDATASPPEGDSRQGPGEEKTG
jgi:large subunit ribosomal protein L9